MNKKDIGHQKRKNSVRFKKNKWAQKAKSIIEDIWAQKNPTPEVAWDIYEDITSVFDETFTSPESDFVAKSKLLEKIKIHNRACKDASNHLPEITLPIRQKRTPPSIHFDWIKDGKEISRIYEKALSYWASAKTEINQEEQLGWTLFFLAIGGLNDHDALITMLHTIVNKKPTFYDSKSNDLTFLLKVPSTSYSNHFNENKFYRYYQYLPNELSLVWIARGYQTHFSNADFRYERLLNKALKQIDESVKLPWLLKNASYVYLNNKKVSISQALVNVANGTTNTCSMTPEEHALFQFDFKAIKRLDLDIYHFLNYHSNFINSSEPSDSDKEKRGSSVFIAEIREAIATKNTKMLLELKNAYPELNKRQIIDWAIFSTQQKVASSTTLRYLSVNLAWLSLTDDEDIPNFSSADYEEIYNEILYTYDANRVPYNAGRLLEFHGVLKEMYGAPDIQLDIGGSVSIIRSHIISPTLYQALLDTLQQTWGPNPHDKKILRLIFILAYRTGMRREEIVGLRLGDIEGSDDSYILVRKNKFRSIKTASAYRRIPVHALLSEEELEEYFQFIKERRNLKPSPDSPLFSLDKDLHKHPIPSNFCYRILTELLDRICQKKNRYNFHTLRHSAFSNLALIIEGDSSLIRSLTNYTCNPPEKSQQLFIENSIKINSRSFLCVNQNSLIARYWQS